MIRMYWYDLSRNQQVLPTVYERIVYTCEGRCDLRGR